LSLLGDCDLAALDQPGAATVVGTLKLTVGEKTGWFAGLECRYFGKRPLTEDGAFWSPATGLLNVRLWKVLKTLMSTGLMASPWPSS